jgi:integrase
LFINSSLSRPDGGGWRRSERLTKDNRYGNGDATIILVTHRATAYGLSAGPSIRWEQIDFRTAALHVRRVKQGTPRTHPILGEELRALRRLQRKQEPKSPFVFTSERAAPFSTAGFARMVERAGMEANAPAHAQARMRLRSC